MQLPGSRVPVGGHDHGQWTHPSQLNTKQPPKWRGWPGQRLAGSLFSKTEGAASEWAQAHSCSHTLGGEERYNLKTACKSVKQISIAWISQIIEPQSITNVQCIWPSGEPQLKNLLATWTLEEGTVWEGSRTPSHLLGSSVSPGQGAATQQ